MKEIFNTCKDFRWENIQTIDYKPVEGDSVPTFFNVVRQNIVKTDAQIGFDVRYFECGEDGFTTLEKHEHVHVVVALRGKGKIIVDKNVYAVQPFDLVVIPSWAAHQLINTGKEPFGFLCTVNGVRDKFRLLSAEELDALKISPEVRDAMRVPDGYGS